MMPVFSPANENRGNWRIVFLHGDRHQRSNRGLIEVIQRKNVANFADHEKVKVENCEHDSIDSNRGALQVLTICSFDKGQFQKQFRQHKSADAVIASFLLSPTKQRT